MRKLFERVLGGSKPYRNFSMESCSTFGLSRSSSRINTVHVNIGHIVHDSIKTQGKSQSPVVQNIDRPWFCPTSRSLFTMVSCTPVNFTSAIKVDPVISFPLSKFEM